MTLEECHCYCCCDHNNNNNNVITMFTMILEDDEAEKNGCSTECSRNDLDYANSEGGHSKV